MRELIILSGKGGTGKTSVTASFAHLASAGDPAVRAVIADVDVDADNLGLVIGPEMLEEWTFTGGKIAIIDHDLCTGGGICADVCRFDAVLSDPERPGLPVIDPQACEGCAACVYQCPSGAITVEPQVAGHIYHSMSRFGPFYHASLLPGEDNSGKMVTAVRRLAHDHAEQGDYEMVLVDGPPGIGCPVISAMTGADSILVVAEPGAAGIADMERILDLAVHFKVPAEVCINKHDISDEGTAVIEGYCRDRDIRVVGKIPFDPAVTEAMVEAQPVTASGDGPAAQALRRIWGSICSV